MCGGKTYMAVIFLKDLCNLYREATLAGITVHSMHGPSALFSNLQQKRKQNPFHCIPFFSQDILSMQHLCSGLNAGYTDCIIFVGQKTPCS